MRARVGAASALLWSMSRRSVGILFCLCSACGGSQLSSSEPLVPDVPPPPSSAATAPLVKSFETKTIGGDRYGSVGRSQTPASTQAPRAATPAGPDYGNLNPSPPSPGTPRYGDFNPSPPSQGTPQYGNLNPSPPGR